MCKSILTEANKELETVRTKWLTNFCTPETHHCDLNSWNLTARDRWVIESMKIENVAKDITRKYSKCTYKEDTAGMQAKCNPTNLVIPTTDPATITASECCAFYSMLDCVAQEEKVLMGKLPECHQKQIEMERDFYAPWVQVAQEYLCKCSQRG